MTFAGGLLVPFYGLGIVLGHVLTSLIKPAHFEQCPRVVLKGGFLIVVKGCFDVFVRPPALFVENRNTILCVGITCGSQFGENGIAFIQLATADSFITLFEGFCPRRDRKDNTY